MKLWRFGGRDVWWKKSEVMFAGAGAEMTVSGCWGGEVVSGWGGDGVEEECCMSWWSHRLRRPGFDLRSCHLPWHPPLYRHVSCLPTVLSLKRRWMFLIWPFSCIVVHKSYFQWRQQRSVSLQETKTGVLFVLRKEVPSPSWGPFYPGGGLNSPPWRFWKELKRKYTALKNTVQKINGRWKYGLAASCFTPLSSTCWPVWLCISGISLNSWWGGSYCVSPFCYFLC